MKTSVNQQLVSWFNCPSSRGFIQRVSRQVEAYLVYLVHLPPPN